jgi:hypothetical protein
MSSPTPDRVTTWIFFEFKCLSWALYARGSHSSYSSLYLIQSDNLQVSDPHSTYIAELEINYVLYWEIKTYVVFLPTIKAIIMASTMSST